MSALSSKLRGLRREAGLSPSRPADAAFQNQAQLAASTNLATLSSDNATAAPATPHQSTAADALRRLLQLRGRAVSATRTAIDRELPGQLIAPGLHYTELHTDWPLPPSQLDARFARHDERIDTARLLHFDTETTGLAGGTGTRAFMIGAADWHEGRFRLRQLTISTMAAESAMLAEFARWLAPDSVLVSYNGKCYDAPLLATRYRLARMANPLAGLLHLDLLHPVRRQWRGCWENCRLATAERELLGVLREDDLPGAEAPAAWLSFLRGGDAINLRRVATHNQQDLRSLAGIGLCLSEAAAQTPQLHTLVPAGSRRRRAAAASIASADHDG
jgi:uncharacterized protein YprB with RNaseH-like and TPR domain